VAWAAKYCRAVDCRKRTQQGVLPLETAP
jgi:hypothetical protein